GLDVAAGNALTHPVLLGVVAGLVIGKPAGIIAFSWLAVRSGLADLPESVSWREICGIGSLAGIGFTMALFIGGLAFPEGELLPVAKIAILGGSLLAGTFGSLLLWTTLLEREGKSP
ncbi:MAG: Na+/H+ antiporter NhaA, partial [Burkholderiales bacterium]